MHYKDVYNNISFEGGEFSSASKCLSKEDLSLFLEKFDYFKKENS